MGNLSMFNADENIWHAMDNNSNLALGQEALASTESLPTGIIAESPHAETSEEWKSVLFDQLGVVDLPRTPPRFFLDIGEGSNVHSRGITRNHGQRSGGHSHRGVSLVKR